MGDEPTTPAGQEPATGQEPGGEVFDEQRARALIAKLRDEVKAGKAGEKELADLRAAKKQAEEAALSELEKARKRAGELEAENQRVKAETQAQLTNARIEREAARLGAVDPELVGTLIKPDQIERDADGNPTNLESLIKSVLKAKPYLAADASQGQAPAAGATNPAAGRGHGELTLADVKRMTPAQINANWARVQRAMANGR